MAGLNSWPATVPMFGPRPNTFKDYTIVYHSSLFHSILFYPILPGGAFFHMPDMSTAHGLTTHSPLEFTAFVLHLHTYAKQRQPRCSESSCLCREPGSQHRQQGSQHMVNISATTTQRCLEKPSGQNVLVFWGGLPYLILFPLVFKEFS